jgi:hypothetical protein
MRAQIIAEGTCQHGRTRVELMPHGFPHHGRLVCTACGAFLGWATKPANVERQRLNGYRIAKLAMIEGLTDWELGFIKSIGAQRKLSPKQQGILDELVAQIPGS